MTSDRSPVLDAVARSHGRIVHDRRVERLAQAIAPLLESDWHVLDVGCGDGRLGALVAERARGTTITGLERSVRPETHIPVEAFDGQRIPLGDQSVDAVLLVDVLHHTDDPLVLLTEARRVARRAIIIKDHRLSRPFAGTVLRMMDWVGNRPHGVVLPYNYWHEEQWSEAWQTLGLSIDRYATRLDLYPWPLSWMCETGLHFLVRLTPS